MLVDILDINLAYVFVTGDTPDIFQNLEFSFSVLNEFILLLLAVPDFSSCFYSLTNKLNYPGVYFVYFFP